MLLKIQSRIFRSVFGSLNQSVGEFKIISNTSDSLMVDTGAKKELLYDEYGVNK